MISVMMLIEILKSLLRKKSLWEFSDGLGSEIRSVNALS